jgi:ABC-type Fe3+-hydroxamate transport system substrate-binding protein
VGLSENELIGLTRLPEFEQQPKRVVSLVPSITESLFELGFGSSVVGITDYCIHPLEKLGGLPRVGGPKDPDVNKIAQLNPQLVFANQEENSQDSITSFQNLGIKVWVSFPKNIDESLDVLRSMLAIYHTDRPALQIVTLQNAVDYARAALETQPKAKYFCPIWQDKLEDLTWWMTFNRFTYTHDVLTLTGGENIFSDRERKYPLEADLGIGEVEDGGERDNRYPRVTVEEVKMMAPEVILLPSEPYEFNEQNEKIILSELRDTPAVINKNIHHVDGSLIAWHGTRMGKALQELPQLFSN